MPARDSPPPPPRAEVQDADAQCFAAKLKTVFHECHRVLKDDGLLVFSYHHSRGEGWQSLADAVLGAGFLVVNSHPVKAEMSVATPKSQAKEPIQLDIILVCRKRGFVGHPVAGLPDAFSRARAKLARLADDGFSLSRNDRKIVFFGQLLTAISDPSELPSAVGRLPAELDSQLAAPIAFVPGSFHKVSFLTSRGWAMKSTCLGCLAAAWLTWLVLPSVACVADEPAGRAAAEPDYRLATAWWGELPRKWTPVGWKNHLFRYNVLFNGAIAAQPDLNRRTTPWAGQGMLLWPSAADPADYAAFPQGWSADHDAPLLWTVWGLSRFSGTDAKRRPENGTVPFGRPTAARPRLRQELFAHIPARRT